MTVQFRSDLPVLLTGSMGGDESIIRFARVSSGTEGDEKANQGLLRMLMRDRHGSPFEAPVFQFLIECPIFVAREFFRHRIASYNETSSRYQKLEGNFYVPSEDRPLIQVGKPGAYTFEPGSYEMYLKTVSAHKRVAVTAWDEYEVLLEGGVAREVARNVLPVAVYTKFYVNMNLRSLLNFLSLRWAHEASKTPTFPLYEIQEIAKQMDEFARTTCPLAMEYFDQFGRVAP